MRGCRVAYNLTPFWSRPAWSRAPPRRLRGRASGRHRKPIREGPSLPRRAHAWGYGGRQPQAPAQRPGVDIAFVSTDALAAAAAPGARLSDHLELVARLAPQEVHVLALMEIGSLSELAGKKVSVGPQGSSSAATATALFKALGITVEPQHLDASTAIERLKQGTIDAAVVVGGKPYPLVSAVPTNSGIHFYPFRSALLSKRSICRRVSSNTTIPTSFNRAARCRRSRPAWSCSPQRASVPRSGRKLFYC